MLNYIWLALIVLAVVLGGLEGRLDAVTDAAFDAAKTAVMTIALPLIGITALWLGIMRLAEKAGLIVALARRLRPVLRRLFPDVPQEHPAMGSILMNLAANMIGLTNAATPLGLRAMTDLEKLNPRPGTATNAMCTFLALNTSSVQLLPTTAIGIMAAAGSTNPTAIVGTALIATVGSTAAGIFAVKTLEKLRWFRLPPPDRPPRGRSREAPNEGLGPDSVEGVGNTAPAWGKLVLGVYGVFLAVAFFQLMRQTPASGETATLFLRTMNAVSVLAIPFFLSFFPLYAALHRVRVYEEFVEGAKEGFHVAVRIIPFLVAMLMAIGTFRAAGGVDMLARGLRPVLDLVQFPADLLPLCLTRPLSGSATIGLFADVVKTFGPDSLLARMAGTVLGSTETTFYVIAVYFGSVSVRKTRHAVAAGLLADLAGIIASVVVCRIVFA
ncbi:MAG TPA: nucleoside recognition domain-containing protein [Verrucomicrobiota bacterium]|nr:nucleoside recognition domain-containing protein [Verrucomicrobiota bacterium]